MLRMCRCGAVAPRGASCPNCGHARKRPAGTQHLRNLSSSERKRHTRRLMWAQNRLCASCGQLHLKMELDHIIALGLGGTDEASNLQLLCRECHRDKTRNDRRAMSDAKHAKRPRRAHR